LAADTGATGRTELLGRITDLFLESGGVFSEQEALHAQEIINSLLRTVGSDARQKLAHKIGGLENAPRQVAVRLAHDKIEVARPILVGSPVLEDQDLIEIIDSRTQEHLRAITERDHINERVTRALAEKGNDGVLVSLASNNNARLSRPTAAHLVGCSQTVEPLQKPLIERTDISPDLIFQIYWWAPPATRKKLLGLAKGLDPSEPGKSLPDQVSAATNDIAQQRGTLSPAQQHIRKMVSNETLNQESLVSFLRGGQVAEFVIGLAHMSDLTVTTVRRVLRDKAGEALAMVCKANGFDKELFSSLESLVYGGSTRTPDQVAAHQGIFDQVEPGMARTALSLWRRGPDALVPTGEWPPKGATLNFTLNSAEYINLPGQKLKRLED
jgi:uncharacterized protein (DUF2336 family)